MEERQLPHRKRALIFDDFVDDGGELGTEVAEHDMDMASAMELEEFEVVGDSGAVDEEDDDEDEEDDEEYALRFEGDMDPLSFVDADPDGILPYQQFQKLEYEALAERKRKALAKKREEELLNSSQSKNDEQDIFGASIDEIWDAAGFGFKRKRKGEGKKKGRRKLGAGLPGCARMSPEVSRKLGEANLLYATSKFDEAVELLKEVVRLTPNVPDAYHTLGLLYDALGDRKKALNFYMVAAHLTPKDSALWKRLASWSMEQGNTGQMIHCLTKAIRADPEDIDVRWDRASLYEEMHDYQKAAEAFEQMLAIRPGDFELCKKVAKMQHKTGNIERATQVLDKFIQDHPAETDLIGVNLLAELHMSNGAYFAAVSQIDRARTAYCSGQGLPLDLTVKAGICHVRLGNPELAESYFEELKKERVEEFADLIIDVGDTYIAVSKHQDALRYYTILEGNVMFDNASLSLKLAESYYVVGAVEDAIRNYHKVVEKMPQHVEARMTLVSLLLESERQDDAVALLKPPPAGFEGSGIQWWHNGKIKTKLAALYHEQGKIYLFLETILPVIQESLYVEAFNQKVKGRKRLPKSVLSERVKVLEDKEKDEIFRRIGPVLNRNERAKASRARKLLAKRAAQKEERKAAALAAGTEWESDEDSDAPEVEIEMKQSPLPNLLKDEEHYELLVQACKALVSVQRYWEALEVIHHSLRFGTSFTSEQRDNLRALGAQIAFKTNDARYGYECARYMVQQRPYSLNMWNCYYQVVARSEDRVPRHHKFMLQMRNKYPDCVPAMVICGHQFAMISQSQGALREYLQAYKQQPNDPFINLCVGVSFINLSQGFRLSNRNQCVLQGFAFLYNYQRLCNNSQESNYNLGRAYHSVGLVHLAVNYYEKVFEQYEKDRPVLRLPYESMSFISQQQQEAEEKKEEKEEEEEEEDEEKIKKKKMKMKKKSGHCDLRREAAHNLHLIYKKSGAHNLARQVLLDYCHL